MNYCPHCGHDLRVGWVATDSAEPRVVERPPTVAELIKPVPPPPTAADFPTEDAWAAYKAEAERLHHNERVGAATEAWARAYPDGDLPTTDDLLAWHLKTAKTDGAANGPALSAWRTAGKPVFRRDVRDPSGDDGNYTSCCGMRTFHTPACAFVPPDPDLVMWLRWMRNEGPFPGAEG